MLLDTFVRADYAIALICTSFESDYSEFKHFDNFLGKFCLNQIKLGLF